MDQIDQMVESAWSVFNEYYPSEELEIKKKLRSAFEVQVTKEIVCAWCGKRGKIEDINKHIYDECEQRPERKMLNILEHCLVLRGNIIKALEDFEKSPEVSKFLDDLISYGKSTAVSTQNS